MRLNLLGALMLCLSCATNIRAQAYFELPLVDNANVVQESILKTSDFRVITGMPKRISNATRIESFERIQASGLARLVRLSQNQDIESVYRHYLSLLKQEGSVVFSCEERNCGSSSFWANEEFDDRQLYGRDSDQYYLVARIDSGRYQHWVQIYFVINGRKDRFMYVRQLSAAGEVDITDWRKGFVVEGSELSAKAIMGLRRALSSAPKSLLYVVSATEYDAATPAQKARDTTQARLKDIVAQLNSELPELEGRIKTEARGDLSTRPLGATAQHWFVLYLRD
ncbi:MAG: DUF4892 domain-containing protein [Oleiphilaceae bacterium]|nr:DUF4892 domain-containing protein [Oleiphilaceae bacterium]